MGAAAGGAIGHNSVKCVSYPPRYHPRANCHWVQEYSGDRTHSFEVCRGSDGVWRASESPVGSKLSEGDTIMPRQRRYAKAPLAGAAAAMALTAGAAPASPPPSRDSIRRRPANTPTVAIATAPVASCWGR